MNHVDPLPDVRRASSLKPARGVADVDRVAGIGTTCARCGAPTDGAYRCGACTRADEGSEWANQNLVLAPLSTSAGDFVPSPFFFPLWSMTTAWARANAAGLLPLWVRRSVYLLLLGIVVLSAVLAFRS
jgi:hypothetical protein